MLNVLGLKRWSAPLTRSFFSSPMLTTLSTIAGSIELLAELTAAGIALMLLDKLAAFIRLTYKAGRLTGYAWFTYAVPAILKTADFISWVNSQIDWDEVRSGVIQGLRIFIALVITCCIESHRLLIAYSERLGKLYSALITRTSTPAPVRTAPAPVRTRTRKTGRTSTANRLASNARLLWLV